MSNQADQIPLPPGVDQLLFDIASGKEYTAAEKAIMEVKAGGARQLKAALEYNLAEVEAFCRRHAQAHGLTPPPPEGITEAGKIAMRNTATRLRYADEAALGPFEGQARELAQWQKDLESEVDAFKTLVFSPDPDRAHLNSVEMLEDAFTRMNMTGKTKLGTREMGFIAEELVIENAKRRALTKSPLIPDEVDHMMTRLKGAKAAGVRIYETGAKRALPTQNVQDAVLVAQNGGQDEQLRRMVSGLKEDERMAFINETSYRQNVALANGDMVTFKKLEHGKQKVADYLQPAIHAQVAPENITGEVKDESKLEQFFREIGEAEWVGKKGVAVAGAAVALGAVAYGIHQLDKKISQPSQAAVNLANGEIWVERAANTPTGTTRNV